MHSPEAIRKLDLGKNFTIGCKNSNEALIAVSLLFKAIDLVAEAEKESLNLNIGVDVKAGIPITLKISRT